MGIAYYKRYPRDFLEGTIDLSFEEKGAYALVLDLIYIHEGGLPDNAPYIAGRLGCSVRKWSVLRISLVRAGKLYLHGNVISNFRADAELESLANFSNQQAEKRRKPNKNKAQKSPRFNHPNPYPEPEREKLSAPPGAERVSLSLEEASQAEARSARLSGERASAQIVAFPGSGPSEGSEADRPAWLDKRPSEMTPDERVLAKAHVENLKIKGPSNG